jgi:hypothetical protein
MAEGCTHFPIRKFKLYGGIEGTSEIFYLSRAHAMGDIKNILSITCARDGGHHKYFIYHVRTQWGTSEIFYLSCAHAMEDIRNILSITCARDGGHQKYFICHVRT